MSYSSGRINRLARKNNAQRYLEIGVAEGNTFHHVDIQHKTAVDPLFAFDLSAYADRPGHFYFNTGSDAFFGDLENIKAGIFGQKDFAWDIVFLDGLHTYGQTMRDFSNSLQYTHEKTIWIFDDTVPSDPWAALPDMNKCYFFRDMTGIESRAWQGDVYKCVFALHDFFPEFSYATIIGAGNPQTVVWRTEETSARRRIFRDEKEINNLGYFAMLERCAALNPMPEKEAFDFIGNKFEKPRRDGTGFLASLIPHLTSQAR